LEQGEQSINASRCLEIHEVIITRFKKPYKTARQRTFKFATWFMEKLSAYLILT
jgi:hypothetical protein